MGVPNVAVVYDEKEEVDLSTFPSNVEKHERAELQTVQEKYAKLKGVSAIVYVQTCAAEKRRRRKRGNFPDPDKRVFINTDVCEGCGDCGVQSNCVSIVPVETELGRKRAIDQSSCNKDFSCLKGFCPSFVTLDGAKVKKPGAAAITLPDLPAPTLPAIHGTHNIVITGVGGTGVITVSQIIGTAAMLGGFEVRGLDQTGLSQKAGGVTSHIRLSETDSNLHGLKVRN
jgi:indolepyruvate ferredoxin oxidoreductase